MTQHINYVDICCGLCWGDEGKGKIVSQLSKHGEYDFVCRWAGGNNAGHTVYVEGKKYDTHLIPSGVFFGIKSIIGPDCVVNIKSFFEEVEYLNKHGFNTDLIKISPKAHIVLDKHIEEDKKKYANKLGTTAKGIGPCYRDKYTRLGDRASLYKELKDYMWDETLYGNILCEGAQGVWLDINYGNYPYVTSSSTLPYGAMSLGIPPQVIRKIYGAAKIYDTRSGFDPDFPDTLLEDSDLFKIGELGEEYGVTTGRRRIINWLNLDKLIKSINISGTTNVIISKIDILEKLNIYKYIYENKLIKTNSMRKLREIIESIIFKQCRLVKSIKFSNNPNTI